MRLAGIEPRARFLPRAPRGRTGFDASRGMQSGVPALPSGIGETAQVTTIAKGREHLGSRAWADEAVGRIEADANRSADTHLHPFPLPEAWGIDLYLKDESVHPTGSLKHRLARSLFLYGLCNGWIGGGATDVAGPPGP